MFTPNLARKRSTFTKNGVCLNSFFDGFGISTFASYVLFSFGESFSGVLALSCDVFCEGFPQSFVFGRLSGETRRRDIFPFYTPSTHLRPYRALVLRLTLIFFLKRLRFPRRCLPVVLPFHQPLVVRPRLLVRELPVVHARAFRFHAYFFRVH